MEFLNWKNILLEWANRLNYLGRTHYSLNMVEIEAFYHEFRTNVTSKDIASKKLDSFLTSYFPEFLPSWTNEGKMSPDDYVFGFSLLMYFACVKHPDVNIQRICKEMQGESQLVVGTFLKNLLDSNSFSRETIKCVIESSGTCYEHQLNRIVFTICNILCVAPAKLSDYVLALSPTKISETNMCLATPKSKILNEWNAENRQLKAQVETERFERGFLEALLKKKEEEISDLHQERRKFQADIQQLKSKLTDKDTENIPVNYNDSQTEMLKRRLRKDIADKEAEINKLQTKVDDLTTAKQHFAEKLSLVESQYNKSIECSAELADKLEQLTETCDKQQEHIKGLEINIKEYQKYFNESSSKGNSLETSSDNLEDSFALAMASLADRSTSSPENMGQVVDMQLREQIALYESLQEKCIRIEEENSQLREQVEEHIQRTSVLELQCRDVMEENKIIAQRDEKKSAELTAVSEELNSNATKLQALRSELDSLTSTVNENHQTIEILNEAKSTLEQQLNVRENEIAVVRIQLETANAKLDVAESMRLDLVSQHGKNLRQKEKMLAELESEKNGLTDQLNALTSRLSNAEEMHEKWQTQMEKKTEELDAELRMGKNRRQKEKMLAELESEKNGLTDQLNALTSRLSNAEEMHEKWQTQMEKKTEELDAELRKTIRELADCQSDRDSLQKTVADLTDQIALLSEENQTIDSQLADLTSTNEQVVSSLAQQLNVRENEVAVVRTQLEAANAKLDVAETMRLDLVSQHEEILRQKDVMLAELETEKHSLTDQLNALTSRLSNAEEIHEKQQMQIAELVQTMEKEAEKLGAELRKTISQLADCQRDRDSLQQTVADLTDQIAILSAERQTIDSQLADLTSFNEQVVSDRDQLRDGLNALEKERIELEARLSTVESSRDDLEAQLSQSEDEKEKLFLNLQEKIDEAEATELTVKEWSRRCASEAAKYETAAKTNQLACEAYEKQISDLTNAVSKLTAGKENWTEVHSDLRKEASHMRMELETMRSLGEQHSNEKKQFLASIEELTVSKNANETEVRQLQQKLNESNDEHVKLVGQCNALETENRRLQKSVEDLESKRDALISQLDVAEREVADAHKHLHQKGQEVNELSTAIDQLKSESATSLAVKANVEAELQHNVDLVKQLSKELEENKTNLVEKSQLVDLLRDQVETLKVTEVSMITKSTELSENYEALVTKLTLAESSKDSLSLQCTSLTEELKAVQDKCKEIENKFAERSLQASAQADEVKSLEMQVDSLKNEMSSMSEVAARKQSELNAMLLTSQEEMAANLSKADAKIEELKLSITELTVQNESLSVANTELSRQLSHNKIEFESYQRSTDYKAEIEALVHSKETLIVQVNDLTSETKKLAEDLEKARRENVSLTDENIDLATEIEKVRTEYADSEASNRDKINSLKSELNQLETSNSINHRRIDELQKSVEAKSNDSSAKDKCAKLEADLNVALADLETKIQECRQGQEIHAQLVHDNKILSAKLTQHRKMAAEQEEAWLKERTELMEQREKSCTEIRFELEGKLSKMKERMKHIYNEETSRSKEKQEKQERELTNCKHQCQLLTERNDKYVAHVQSLSTQVYKLNEQILELKKENEFLKSKLRLAECNPRESRLFPPPNFGSNLKIEMEDELGEVFNNVYLADLKSGAGRTSPVGRESIRQSELRQRNSIAARHLRSTYAAQYGDQNLKEEDISMPYFNDSMFSNQLDVRRGTLYQRPGPPTPSKNGGRLSFGGSTINASDLFPKDILREQNTTAKTKTTPGKLMSMFSSSKHKETDVRKAITRPIYATFTSSTPRQKSNWARERKSILAIKLNSTDSDDDDVASIVSNDSLLSKTSGRRRSITHRFSIISKSKRVSAVSSLIQKNRIEYRKKNHSKRQKGFEQSREMFLKLDEDDDDDNNFQMVLREEIGYIQPDELFTSDLRPSEKFEVLTKRTVSEHPYSNEPTTIEAIEASESSWTSSAACHSKTMGNIIMFGRIPRITVNETPQRELIHYNRRSASIWLRLMDLTKECFLALVLVVVYASYVMWNFLSRRNE
ncbi:hypothetical protein HA402_015827 [Bradysia odoriphaga]|nr:hypothetical protein HA402_015827 [Bradysia odoriphaga]